MIKYKARCNGLSGNRTHYGRPLAALLRERVRGRINSSRGRGLTSVKTEENDAERSRLVRKMRTERIPSSRERG